jgi:hypothetical protein
MRRTNAIRVDPGQGFVPYKTFRVIRDAGPREGDAGLNPVQHRKMKTYEISSMREAHYGKLY